MSRHTLAGCMFALLATASLVIAASEPVDLLRFPVHVSATAEFGRQAGLAVITLTLEQETGRFMLTTLQTRVASAEEGIERQRTLTGWKDGYLFVRDSCVGGNAWRCDRDHVFTLIAGKKGKDELVYVGAVASGEDCNEPGCALEDGVFTDIYDGLEANALTSHADAPALIIGVNERGGRFVVDPDLTWDMNQERYTAGLRCLANQTSKPCTERVTPKTALLFNALLARYTGRRDELSAFRLFTRGVMCEGLDEAGCLPVLAEFERIITQVTPGGLPANTRRPRELPDPAVNLRVKNIGRRN
jgi:hypothetical protein